MNRPEALDGINAFYGTKSFLGTIESFTPPKIDFKIKEFDLGGIGGVITRPLRRLESLEAEVTFRESTSRLADLVGSDLEEDLILYGSISDGQEERSHKIILRGYVKASEENEFKNDSDVSTKLTINVYLYQRFIDNEELYHIDLFNNEIRIAGKDRNLKLKENLGL